MGYDICRLICVMYIYIYGKMQMMLYHAMINNHYSLSPYAIYQKPQPVL